MRKSLQWLIVVSSGIWLPGAALATTSAKYVILFHGDGMGLEHVKAGGMYTYGAAGTLVFESLSNSTTMTHNNASNGTTDSAASASAMATGFKVNNSVISVRLPGSGSDSASILELYKSLGKSAGLVTTSYITDASPAAHGAHDSSRYNYANINNDFLNQTQPHILFGGGGNSFDLGMAASKGYSTLSDRASLLGLNTEIQTRVAGSFGTGAMPADGMAGRDPNLPTLPEMTQQALAVLDNNSEGFFLFIEHEGIDEYSHSNDAEGLVKSMAEFNSAVQQAINWINDPTQDADWSNTLILLLADHETGGLTVTETNPQIGVIPAVTWSSTGHTQTPVPVFAQGADAGQITGTQIDNKDIFTIAGPPSASTCITTTLTSGEDTWMDAAAPDTTHGTDAKLVIDGNPDNGALIAWNLSTIPAGSTINVVTLIFNLPDGNDQSGSVFEFYASQRNWTDVNATWNNFDTGLAWGIAGSQNSVTDYTPAVLASSPTSGTPPIRMSIALNADGIAQVQRWVNGADPNYGFVVFDYADASSDGFRFNSFDSANPPQLVVNYCPPVSTPTITPTLTATPSATGTATCTSTPTPSSSPTPSATDSSTATQSPTPTHTPSFTPTSTASPVLSLTPTDSSTPTQTITHSPTPTSTPSPTASATLVVSPTSTSSPTATSTHTPTLTTTHTSTATASPTVTVPTLTCSPTCIVSPSATVSLTTTPTQAGSVFKKNKVVAYPNPGKDRIQFGLILEQSKPVKIVLFNPAGERVAVLYRILPAGPVKLVWECDDVAAGLYLAIVYLDGQEVDRLKVCVIR